MLFSMRVAEEPEGFSSMRMWGLLESILRMRETADAEGSKLIGLMPAVSKAWMSWSRVFLGMATMRMFKSVSVSEINFQS